MNASRIDLVVFDMDGVISDTQQYHAQSEIEILKAYGITQIFPDSAQTITSEWISSNFAGVQPKERMKKLFDIHNKGDLFDIHTIEEEKKNKLLSIYTDDCVSIEFINGAKELLHSLFTDVSKKTAVVTASTRECMIHVLTTLEIVDQFDDLVSIYDIDPITEQPYPSKGNPEVYQRLKEKYGVASFIMIEDGATGMNGAISAGGKAMAIGGGVEKFPQAISWHTDLSSVDVKSIEDILS